MVKVRDLLQLIDSAAPWRLAEKWDNCGLMVGSVEAEARRVALALDPTLETIQKAHDLGAHILLTHHPLISKPLKALDLDNMTAAAAALALRLGLQVVSAHTNLDAAQKGVTRALAQRLGLEKIMPLKPAEECWGFGGIGELAQPITIKGLVGLIREKLSPGVVRVAAAPAGPVRRLALMPGSGGGFLQTAYAHGAEVFISGDLGYHVAREAEQLGLCLIDAGHWATERPVLEAWAKDLTEAAGQAHLDLEFEVLTVERDPWSCMEG